MSLPKVVSPAEWRAARIALLGRRQLLLGHFMFEPEWEDGCPSCSAGCDEVSQGWSITCTRATPR